MRGSVMKRSLLLAVMLATGGCAHWTSGPEAPFMRWKCQGQSYIAWRYADAERRHIELKIGRDEQIHRLKKEPATRGAFYSDGVVAFHDRGNEALVYRLADDRLLAHGCSPSLFTF